MPMRSILRRTVGPDVWSAAVSIARRGQAVLERRSADEILVKVRMPGRPVPYEVFLWPSEGDWGCDCPSRAEACVHVAAAAIVSAEGFQSELEANAEPAKPAHTSQAPANVRRTPPPSTRARVRHALERHGQSLSLSVHLVKTDPRTGREVFKVLRGSLSSTDAWANTGDLQVEAARVTLTGPNIPAELWPRLVRGLAQASEVTLDGEPIRADARQVAGIVRVDDDGEGFLVRLVRDPAIDEQFDGGVVRCGQVLHPVGYGDLKPHQRQVLFRGMRFAPQQVAQLVGEVLPTLKKNFSLDIRTRRLPDAVVQKPRLHLHFEKKEDHSLDILPTLVYGAPPSARVDRHQFVLLQGKVPIRDLAEEERLKHACFKQFRASPGQRCSLSAEEAIRWVARDLPSFNGTQENPEVAGGYSLRSSPLQPGVHVEEMESGRYRMHLDGDGASDTALLQAWQRGDGLVPLTTGGFAHLPPQWLEENGWRLAELMALRDKAGEIPLHAVPSLAALAEASHTTMPASLQRLRDQMQDFTGIPPVPAPAGLRAELRAYQRQGMAWLAFLRGIGSGGILADDMGLGKTLQALCALAATRGPHLVVAPTSVIHNWQLEAERFLPTLSVCVFHGARRALDEHAQLVITSYALLRRDLDMLAARRWAYVVLDEAQTIKNPDSQVAQAARSLNAEHRLALTGTPIENRLEELWSLFAFLMPGLLGARREFTERITASIAMGAAPDALAWLRRRVRPFILRRMKQEVAPELPPRTDIVLRCELGDDQNRIYAAVHQVACGQALAALDAGRTLGALEALLRLRQAACHPSLLPGNHPGNSAKLDLLLDRLGEVVAEGHRALVFSQWTAFLDLVEPELRRAGLNWVRLDGSTPDRQRVVDRFQADDGPPVFLISLKAGGTGLNLTAADYVFHLDPWWNPAVEDQAVDRAHRIGQERPVISCRLIAADTVEERIIALQESKRELARAAIGDEQALTTALTRADLASLFQ